MFSTSCRGWGCIYRLVLKMGNRSMSTQYETQFTSPSTHLELLQYVRATLNGYPSLLKREFVDVSKKTQNTSDRGQVGIDQKSTSPFKVRIFQWNLLAQALCLGADNFIKCPKEALEWKPRRLHILEELLLYEPDVICLEEVDQYEFIQSALESIGYKGTFYPKPDSPCLYCDESYGPDGCAIFHNTKKLKSISIHNVNLKKENASTNQVAIIQKLQYCNHDDASSSGQEFYVGVTHLKAREGWGEFRNLQGIYLLKKIKEIAGSSPLIFMGDFNGDPNEPVYSTFKNSDLNFGSAYTKLTEDGTEPPYTTWKIRGGRLATGSIRESCKTLDYMWYTKSSVTVDRVLKFPTGEEMGVNKLPSFNYPSDHLSLVCDFSIG
ncbi:nocturnin isoform X2 [Lingula anatina]|uniref:Nocturnin n=1 Tax=Lingula anatina TaxID=7574 RepID=A0A1S3JRU2_LINAN|nr:nocturnin isoform X2 [Lingula anatina]|eukprot:XP_013413138.1 nocturnin isoform X2 [Lingula anatina]